MKTEKLNNPRAFPLVIANKESNFLSLEGLTLLDYFIAHAPSKPLWDFDIPMETQRPKKKRREDFHVYNDWIDHLEEILKWNKRYEDKRSKIWASEWASEQLKQRLKYL